MRNEMGLTQSDVAIKSGLTQQMVSCIETIGNSPTLKFHKVCGQLGLNKAWEECQNEVQ